MKSIGVIRMLAGVLITATISVFAQGFQGDSDPGGWLDMLHQCAPRLTNIFGGVCRCIA